MTFKDLAPRAVDMGMQGEGVVGKVGEAPDQIVANEATSLSRLLAAGWFEWCVVEPSSLDDVMPVRACHRSGRRTSNGRKSETTMSRTT